jgi:tetratricopeptide (TPR) repeat protein
LSQYNPANRCQACVSSARGKGKADKGKADKGNARALAMADDAHEGQIFGDDDPDGEAAAMAYAKTSLRKEKQSLRDKMRATGLDHRQIAAEFTRAYGLRPRTAWREGYGWSLVEAAERINSYRGNTGLDPGGFSGMTAPHLSEYENWPGNSEQATGRKPSPYLLAALGEIYGCHVTELIDLADRAQLPAADLLVLDTYTRPRPSTPAVQAPESQETTTVRVPNVILRRIREQERHETRSEFAEALAQTAREMGESVEPSERYVARLEDGDIRYPRPAYRRVLVALCGRPMDELGFAHGEQPEHFRDDHNDERNRPSGSMAIDSSEPGPDTIVLNLLLGDKEVIVPISRRFLLHAGVSSFVEAFALDQQFDMVNDIMQRPRRAERLTIASPAHLQEILIHLREQWHALVKTDNLLGPRFALAGVLNQISVVEALRSILRDEQRTEVARLGAKYAESAAWLYEDTDNMTQARSWTSQAMEWAYEGNDERMLAWTIFRRAQQAAAVPDAAQTIGLAQAARRNEEKLATPTRAAIRVQEAYGHALDGNDQAAQRLLDEAHTWAAGDTVGDAREGHGSYCTPGYIEIQRGHCWLATGQPKKAISLYEDSLRTLPTVYQRNRAATLTRLAVAYTADSQPEQAANTAHAALPVARSAGSMRIVGEIKNVGTELIPYRALPAVAALLDELEAEDH